MLAYQFNLFFRFSLLHIFLDVGRSERIVEQGKHIAEAERGFDPGPAGVHGNLKVGINRHGIYGKRA